MLHKSNRSRSGFTVLELLVSISIIGLFLALTIPAVQRARAAADLVRCKNQLKQIGVAAHDFHSAKGVFPEQNRYLLQLLPHLEQDALHKALEEQLDNRPSGPTSPVPEGLGAVPLLACPSNEVDLGNYEVSYVVNAGHQHTKWSQNQIDPANGMLFRDYTTLAAIRISDVRDGTSNTVLFSEQRPFSESSRLDSYFYELPNLPSSANEFRDLCLMATDDSERRNRRATPRLLNVPFYQHVNLPNEPSCYVGGTNVYDTSSRSASSWHTGGVNVLMVDGSVKFVANEIDEIAWRELGSRNSDIEPTELWAD